MQRFLSDEQKFKHTTWESSRRLGEIVAVMHRYKLTEGVTPEKLRGILEDLGPTFVKLGQIMSMRSDMLPLVYCDEFAKLRMDVRPMTFSEVETQLVKEYGCDPYEIFSVIDSKPLGSASIAQVHRATLLDGRIVAVKVQRAGIEETISRDIMLMRRAVATLKIAGPPNATNAIDLSALIDELWVTLQMETDFLEEAANLDEFARDNKDIAYVECPEVFLELCTKRILVMEFVEGIRIDDIPTLQAAGYDIDEIGRKIAESFTKQIVDDGFFHADPHPGNLIVRDGRLVWIDLGMIGRLGVRERELFRKLVMSMVFGDVSGLKKTLLTIGTARVDVDHSRLLDDIDRMLATYGTENLVSLDLGAALRDLFELVRRHGIRLPATFFMLGRGYVTVEGLIAKLAPNLNTIEIMADHLKVSLIADFDFDAELKHIGASLYTLAKRTIDLPNHVIDVFDMASKGQLKMNMAVTGSEEPIRKLGVIIDRLGIALISVGLFLGSSILCTTEMTPRILGIPLLGAAGYFGAAALSIWFIVEIVHEKR